MCTSMSWRAILALRESMGTVHVDEWSDAPDGGAEEMEALCERLRAHLENDGCRGR